MNHVNIIGKVVHITTKEEEYVDALVMTTSSEIIGEEVVKSEVFHPCKFTGRWVSMFDGRVQTQTEVAIEGRMINENGGYLVKVNDLIIL